MREIKKFYFFTSIIIENFAIPTCVLTYFYSTVYSLQGNFKSFDFKCGLMRFCWNLQQFSSFMEKHFELWTTLNFQVRMYVPTLNIFMAVIEKKYQTSNNKTFFCVKKPLGQFSNNWKQSKYCNIRYQVMLLNSQNTPQKIKALKSEFSFQTQNHIWLKEDFFFKRKNIHTYTSPKDTSPISFYYIWLALWSILIWLITLYSNWQFLALFIW